MESAEQSPKGQEEILSVPQTVNDIDVHGNIVIDGISYVNLISPNVSLVKGDNGKPRIKGIKIGMLVSFIEDSAGHEDKGVVYEIADKGVFVDNDSGIEIYCAFKLREIDTKLIGVALVHKT